MQEYLVKLCSDELAHSKFKQLYGEKPSEKIPARKWELERLAFFLAWDIAIRVTKQRVEEEIKNFFDTVYTEEVYTNSKGEKFISTRYIKELRV